MSPVEILAILTGVNYTLEMVNRLAAGARERGEWTPEQEREFDEKMATLKAKDYWQRTD